jgi:multiple sugar transport system substrate-binding protein
MIKKLLFLSLLLTTLPFFGLGCKGLSAEQQAAVTPVTLNYWTIYNDTAQLRAFADEYKLLRPYVTVNIRQVRTDTFDDMFVTALADNVAPDMVSMHIRNLGKHANRLDPMPSSVQVANMYETGKYKKELVVEQITQNMPTRTSLSKDYVTTVLADISNGNSIYGLPLAIDTMALYYNRDILDKAGIAEPPKTWAEFIEAVKKTTIYNSKGEVVQSGVALGTATNIPYAFDILSFLIMQNGVTPARDNSVLFANGFGARTATNHPVLEALRFYTDFARPTKDVYSWNDTMGNAYDAFVSGKTAFYFGYAFESKRIKARAPQMHIDVVSLLQLNPSAMGNSANYWIETVVGDSTNKDEAWDFIRFMTTLENVEKYTTVTGQVSPYRSQISKQLEDINIAPFAEQALVASNWYQGRDFDVAKKAFDDLITGYLRPYGPEEKPLERDANLVIRSAQTIQQTY